MNKIDRHVIISNKNDVSFEARLIVNRNDHKFELSILSTELSLKDVNGFDFFDCLTNLRQVLEAKHLFILCQGAVTNVYPSRMARDMSDGLKAYSLHLGRRSSVDQLVEIFDFAPIEAVGLIAEQEAFFRKWLDSLNINN